MNQKIHFSPERCMLCFSCVLACEMQSIGVSDVRAIPQGGEACRRISFAFSRGTPWAWKCQHCTFAPCVEACVTGSLIHEKGSSRVAHRPETCVGCGSCLLACPFNALKYDGKKERVTKCNLCFEEKAPLCVKACPSGALVYYEPNIFASKKKRGFAQELRRSHEAG